MTSEENMLEKCLELLAQHCGIVCAGLDELKAAISAEIAAREYADDLRYTLSLLDDIERGARSEAAYAEVFARLYCATHNHAARQLAVDLWRERPHKLSRPRWRPTATTLDGASLLEMHDARWALYRRGSALTWHPRIFPDPHADAADFRRERDGAEFASVEDELRGMDEAARRAVVFRLWVYDAG
jgi:hypothetical protein